MTIQVAPPGEGGSPGPAQRIGLRLAAAFGDRLGEVGEEDRQPQPDGDDIDEPQLAVVATRELEEEDAGRDHRAELDDEHDRVSCLQPRVVTTDHVPPYAPAITHVQLTRPGDIERFADHFGEHLKNGLIDWRAITCGSPCRARC